MASTHLGVVRNGKVESKRPLTLPDGSQVRITLSPVLNKREAMGKANVWLAHHVGDAVGAMKGVLTETDQLTVWRFEAFITGSTIDPLGPLGQIDVDADTGQILSTSQTAEAMIQRGRQLVPAS